MSNPIPPLSEVLARLNSGSVDAVAGADLADLVQAVMLHESKGSITVTIDVSALGTGQVKLAAACSVKRPKTKAMAEAMWVTEDGALSRSDPMQQQITFESSKPADSAIPDTGETK